MTFTPCARVRNTTKLNSSSWFEYTKGSSAAASVTGRTTSSAWRSALGTAHLPAEQSAGAHEQDEDQQQVRQQVRPGAEVSLHEHERDAVDDAAQHRAEGVAERADHDHRERLDVQVDAHRGRSAAQHER